MFHAKNLPLYFQVEALNTACHIHNLIDLRPEALCTNYRLWEA